ncbi:MAG: OB-fold nucleic acid binding domain-containing protein [Planctomycetota bacterium]
MKQFTTGYCGACEAQVTRTGRDGGTGPDGVLYCDECRRMLLLMQEQRHPGSTPAAPRPVVHPARPKPGAASRPVVSPDRPKPAAASRRDSAPRAAASRLKPLGIGAAILGVALAGLWWTNRSTGRPDAPPSPPAAADVPPRATAPVPVASSAPTPLDPAPQPAEPVRPPDPSPAEPAPPLEPPPAEPAPPTEPPPAADPPPSADSIRADDLAGLRAVEGRSASVAGVVTRAAAAPSGKVFFINFSDDRDGFVAVIFQKKLADFEARFGSDLPGALAGKSVIVRGKVSTYQGRPQMVLEEPSQIEVK